MPSRLQLCGLLLCAAPWAGAQEAQRTRMNIQILPENPDSPESTSTILNKLRNSIADGDGDGSSAADAFSLLGNIQPETLSAQMTKEKDHAAVDVYSQSGFNAVANDDFKVTAGASFKGRIQDKADVVVGGLEVQTLKTVSVSAGDHADVSVDGAIGVASTGAVSLDAATVDTRVKGSTGLLAGGDLRMAAGGDSSLDSASLSANIRGDIDASGGALSLAGTKKLSVVAGDVDVQTPGSVRLAGKGGFAEIDSKTDVEFVNFIWRSSSSFQNFENPLPEEVTDVTEVVIRAKAQGSPAEVVASSHTTLTMQIGEVVDGNLVFKTVWTSNVGQGTYSLDGLVVQLDRLYNVAALRLASSTGDGKTYTGWSEVHFLLGREIASGSVRVASASTLEATAASGLLMSAQNVQLNAASELDVSASDSARLVSSDVSVKASNSLEAASASLDLHVSDSIDAYSGGDVSGSFAAVTAEARGDAELAAAGDVSVAGESAKLSLSGALNADAQSIKLHTDTLETMTSQLSATIAEAASLHTTDASLSASGTLSAYMAGGEVVAEGDMKMQSAGELAMRTQGSIELDTVDSATLRSKSLSTTTGSLQVHAGGGDEGSVMNVEVDCDDCANQEEQFRAQMAEMLGVPVERLVVTEEEPEAADGSSGRRRAQEQPAAATKSRRGLALWSVKELEKWLASSMGLRGVAARVSADRVDGAMAAEMDKNDWKQLGCSGLQSARVVSALKKFTRQERAR